MKITLDIDLLLSEKKISRDEYEKLIALAERSTGSLAFNLLIGFGVIAVSGSALALSPAPSTAVIIGVLALTAGLGLLSKASDQWKILSNISILVGALMTGGGIIVALNGSLLSILSVTLIFAVSAVFSGSSLLSVLATLMLSASIGARTGYFHASYFLIIQEPIITIILFTSLATGLYKLSQVLSLKYERIAIASARTSVLLVNFGLWVGSLWGERAGTGEIIMPDYAFAALWAFALMATAMWSWHCNRRWVLNTTATFGGIHFYTQWFERLGASPETVLLAGFLALVFAMGIRSVNNRMKTRPDN